MSTERRPPVRRGVTCQRGHDDWYVFERLGHGISWVCRPCKLEWDRERRLQNGRRRSSRLDTHCIRGHEFTSENTVFHRHGRQRHVRVCRQCNRSWKRAYQHRNSERLRLRARAKLEIKATLEGRQLPSYTPRGEARAVCRNGHDRLVPGNLIADGRACRQCRNDAARRRNRERKAKAAAYDVVMAQLQNEVAS